MIYHDLPWFTIIIHDLPLYLPNGCLVAKRPQQRCRKLRAVAQELRAQDLGVRKAPRQLEASHLQTCEKRQRRQRRFKIKEGSDSELIFHLRFMAMYIYNYSWWDVNWIYHLSEWIKTHLATSVTYIHHHSSDVAEFGRYSLSKSKGVPMWYPWANGISQFSNWNLTNYSNVVWDIRGIFHGRQERWGHCMRIFTAIHGIFAVI